MLRRWTAAPLVTLVVVTGCGDAPDLVGEWEAISDNAEGSAFPFGAEQTQTFIRRGGGGS